MRFVSEMQHSNRTSTDLTACIYAFSFITRKTIMQELDRDTSDPMIEKKSSTSIVAPIFKWKVLAIVFILISVVLLITLIVIVTK